MKSIHFTPIVGLGLCLLASACKAPVHLSYDFGRAYQATFPVQSDLTLKVTEGTTDAEDASSTLSATGGN